MKTKIIKTKTLSKKYSLLLLFLICFTINIKAQYVEQKLGNDVEHSELRLNSIFANYGIANYYGILEIRAGSFGNGAPLLSIHPYNQQVRIPGTLLIGTSTHINNTIAHFDGRVYISEKDGNLTLNEPVKGTGEWVKSTFGLHFWNLRMLLFLSRVMEWNY